MAVGDTERSLISLHCVFHKYDGEIQDTEQHVMSKKGVHKIRHEFSAGVEWSWGEELSPGSRSTQKWSFWDWRGGAGDGDAFLLAL